MISGHLTKRPWYHIRAGSPALLILTWIMAIGLVIQISGKVWLISGSARNTQVYLWLLAPALLLFINRLFVNKVRVLRLEYLPWLAFLIWAALSTSWSDGADTSATSLAKRSLFIALYLLSILFLLDFNERLLKRAIVFSIVLVAIGAGLSLAHQYGYQNKPMAYRAYRIDRMGFGDFANYGWPVAAGIFHGAVAVWVMGKLLSKDNSPWAICVWLPVLVTLVFYVVMTGSRGSWFALVAGFVLSAVLHKSKFCLWASLCTFVVGVAFVVFRWEVVVSEVASKQFSGRGPIWDYFFKVMTDHWMIGYGLGTPFSYKWPDRDLVSPHAHSLYLQQIYDSGIISLAFLVFALILLVIKCWKLRSTYWVRLASPPLLFALVAMLTDIERLITRPGDYWTVFWLPVGILLALPGQASKRLIESSCDQNC